jgi:hypothetical protein
MWSTDLIYTKYFSNFASNYVLRRNHICLWSLCVLPVPLDQQVPPLNERVSGGGTDSKSVTLFCLGWNLWRSCPGLFHVQCNLLMSPGPTECAVTIQRIEFKGPSVKYLLSLNPAVCSITSPIFMLDRRVTSPPTAVFLTIMRSLETTNEKSDGMHVLLCSAWCE